MWTRVYTCMKHTRVSLTIVAGRWQFFFQKIFVMCLKVLSRCLPEKMAENFKITWSPIGIWIVHFQNTNVWLHTSISAISWFRREVSFYNWKSKIQINLFYILKKNKIKAPWVRKRALWLVKGLCLCLRITGFNGARPALSIRDSAKTGLNGAGSHLSVSLNLTSYLSLFSIDFKCFWRRQFVCGAAATSASHSLNACNVAPHIPWTPVT